MATFDDFLKKLAENEMPVTLFDFPEGISDEEKAVLALSQAVLSTVKHTLKVYHEWLLENYDIHTKEDSVLNMLAKTLITELGPAIESGLTKNHQAHVVEENKEDEEETDDAGEDKDDFVVQY